MAVEMRAMATFMVHQADPSCHMSVLCFAHGHIVLHLMTREQPCIITSQRNQIHHLFVCLQGRAAHGERETLCLESEKSENKKKKQVDRCVVKCVVVVSTLTSTLQRDGVILLHILLHNNFIHFFKCGGIKGGLLCCQHTVCV